MERCKAKGNGEKEVVSGKKTKNVGKNGCRRREWRKARSECVEEKEEKERRKR